MTRPTAHEIRLSGLTICIVGGVWLSLYAHGYMALLAALVTGFNLGSLIYGMLLKHMRDDFQVAFNSLRGALEEMTEANHALVENRVRIHLQGAGIIAEPEDSENKPAVH